MKIKIIECGTTVRPKLLKVDAIITAICIRFERVTYEISYFNNGEYKTVWLSESELNTVTVGKDFKVGYK